MTPVFELTPHRTTILTKLLEAEISDDDGMCTRLLMETTGHRTSNALSGVLLAMEDAGLVERHKAGRRTYRIWLTPEGRRLAEKVANGVKIDEPLAVSPPARAVPMGDLERLQARIEMLEKVVLNQSEALRARQ